MTQKTFCDGCGDEIVNEITRINVETVHYTKSFNEPVGRDDYATVDICHKCKMNPILLPELLAGKLRTYEGSDECRPLNPMYVASESDGFIPVLAPRVELGPDALTVNEGLARWSAAPGGVDVGPTHVNGVIQQGRFSGTVHEVLLRDGRAQLEQSRTIQGGTASSLNLDYDDIADEPQRGVSGEIGR